MEQDIKAPGIKSWEELSEFLRDRRIGDIVCTTWSKDKNDLKELWINDIQKEKIGVTMPAETISLDDFLKLVEGVGLDRDWALWRLMQNAVKLHPEWINDDYRMIKEMMEGGGE